MPYFNERAHRLGHVPTVNNVAIHEAFSRWQVAAARPQTDDEIKSLSRPLESLVPAKGVDAVEFAITVDGSDLEIAVTRDHPSVKVGYLRVAGSFLELSRLNSVRSQEFPNPGDVYRMHSEWAFDGAFPGAGLVSLGKTAVNTWREEVDRFLRTTRFDQDSSSTLSDALLSIFGIPGIPAESIELSKCPECGYDNTCLRQVVTKSGGTCSNCRTPLFLSDVLRTYEEYIPDGSNLTPLTRLMLVSERLMTLSYLEHFFKSAPNPEEVFRHTIFITDGPLALFGVVAPLKRRIYSYHEQLFEWAAARNLDCPLIVGVEKGGQFVDHAELIADMIPKGNVMMLSTAYINRITGRPEGNAYGSDEFYGRRFIYRTSSGKSLVITVPPKPGVLPYEGEQSEIFDSYPTLRAVCEVLDSVQTRLYPNALIPLALAHNSASLPLGVGQSVLRAMAQEGMGLPVNSQFQQRLQF